MAISIDWSAGIIYVPKDYCSLVQTSPTEIRDLDTNQFRLDLKSLEWGFPGMGFPRTHNHYAPISVGGIELARVVEITNDYTITFEDGPWAVNLKGSNNNILDRTNKNQVSVNPSNSAGLVTSSAIEYSEYVQGIVVDVDNGFSGSVYPIGTMRKPVNNFADAVVIAESRGINTFLLKSDVMLSAGHNISNKILLGENPSLTSLFVGTDADVLNCEIRECTVEGTLDGNTVINRCVVNNIDYMNGEIRNSIINGTITLGGGSVAHILSCFSGVPGSNIPIIDMGGSGQALALRNYNGNIKLINKTGIDVVSIDLNSGQVILEETVSAGTIILNGVGAVEDNTTGTCNVDQIHLVKGNQINDIHEISETSAYADRVYLDVDSGSSGITFPLGLVSSPVNNLADAIEILNIYGGRKIYLTGTLILDQDVSGYEFIGEKNSAILLNNQPCLNTNFNRISVSGIQHNSAHFEFCEIRSISGMQGQYYQCSFMDSNINTLSTGQTIFDNCRSAVIGNDSPTFDWSAGGIDLSVRAYSGGIKYINSSDPSNFCTIDFIAGKLNLEANNTAGFVSARGVFARNDLSGVNFIVNYEGANIQVEDIWGANLDAFEEGEAGYSLNLIYGVETGNWEILNNQMIFKDTNNVELFRVNLFDSTGIPSSEEVYKRVRT